MANALGLRTKTKGFVGGSYTLAMSNTKSDATSTIALVTAVTKNPASILSIISVPATG